MLINLSNHPKLNWDKKQLKKALEKYGSVIDMEFPDINPLATKKNVLNQVSVYSKMIEATFSNINNSIHPNAVHLQGEFTFVYNLVHRLKKNGIKCIASTSKRDVTEENGKKVIRFKFVQFREY
jgi:CRISPR-associated protein Csx16